MKLLRVISTLDPRSGGPAEAVLRTSLRLTDLGHRVQIATVDAPGAVLPADWADAPVEVHALGPGIGRYGYARALLPWLVENARRFDAVLVEGLWQYHGYATRQALRAGDVPYYVFPHGMLDPWFRRAYPLKHAKKWAYWPWAEYRVLRDARAVLYTCEEERRLARESFWLYRARERVVPLGTARPPQDVARLRDAFLARFPALRGRRFCLFLGRLHVKKGLDLLVEAFVTNAARDPDYGLVIAGPDPDGLAAALQTRAAAAGLARRIVWTGMLSGDERWGAFHAADVFALPSHQENFGLAVVEALGCGTPVLISDRVNIWREIAADGAGLVASDTATGTALALRDWLSLAPADAAAMRVAARACFERRFTVAASVTALCSELGAAPTDDRSEAA